MTQATPDPLRRSGRRLRHRGPTTAARLPALIPRDQSRLERTGHVLVPGEDADGETLPPARAAVDRAGEEVAVRRQFLRVVHPARLRALDVPHRADRAGVELYREVLRVDARQVDERFDRH